MKATRRDREPRRACRRHRQRWRLSSSASPSLPPSAKLPLPPWRRHRPHAISPRSISTAPWSVRRSAALSATARSASAGSSRRAPPCSISFRSTMCGSWRTSRKPRSNISGPASAPASPSTAIRTRRLKAWWTALRPAAGLPSACFPTDNATGNFVRVVQRVPVKIRFASNPLPGRLVPGLSARVEIDRGSGS